MSGFGNGFVIKSKGGEGLLFLSIEERIHR
jgi:hypothetical protein